MRTWKDKYDTWQNVDLYVRSKGSVIPGIEKEFNELANNILGLLKVSQDDLILDVGCDSGLVSSRIARYCRKIVGVDFMYKQFGDALKESNLIYLGSDGTHLPFKDGVFDKVYCNNMIHGIDKEEFGMQIINECIRTCKKNGILLIGDVPTIEMRKRFFGIPFTIKDFMEKYTMKQAKLYQLPIYLFLLFIPNFIKSSFRKFLGIHDWREQLETKTIWYSSSKLKDAIELLGYNCLVIPQKKILWSSCGRMNFIISSKANE